MPPCDTPQVLPIAYEWGMLAARWEGPRLRLLPILLVMAVGIAILAASFTLAWFALDHFSPSLAERWPLVALAQGFALILALTGISIARRRLPAADFGLRWPRVDAAWIGKAIAWAVALATIMVVADNAWGLLHGRAPETTAHGGTDLAGWLAFNLLLVGPCEEVLFRGLLLGVLAALSPSRVRFGTRSISTAGIVIALLFALAHARSFAVEPWPIALGQQVYAFAFGLLYVGWRERSGSLLMPVVVHGLSDVVEEAAVYVLAGIVGR
jgi:membrane protease YdiL (CAAX protease family)